MTEPVVCYNSGDPSFPFSEINGVFMRVWRGYELLVDRGVNFDSNNYGRHLVIRDSGLIIDFWPSTGKWTVRESGKYRRGVFNLLKLIKSRAGE